MIYFILNDLWYFVVFEVLVNFIIIVLTYVYRVCFGLCFFWQYSHYDVCRVCGYALCSIVTLFICVFSAFFLSGLERFINFIELFEERVIRFIDFLCCLFSISLISALIILSICYRFILFLFFFFWSRILKQETKLMI